MRPLIFAFLPNLDLFPTVRRADFAEHMYSPEKQDFLVSDRIERPVTRV
jgi:hypothetical protein